MEKILVINKINNGAYSSGETLSGIKVMIKCGYLKDTKKFEAIILEERDSFILCAIPEIYENERVINGFRNDEGLLFSRDLDLTSHCNVYRVQDKFGFIHPSIRNINLYLRNNLELWKNSRLRLTSGGPWHISSARLYGLTFEKALSKLHSRGIQKARFYCEDLQDFSQQGVIAEMLVNLTKDEDGIVSIEVWQGVKNTPQVYYIHGIMDENEKYFTHFDGAKIAFSIDEMEMLFMQDTKIKGGEYNKMFRVDGIISKNQVFEMANQYLPLDNIIDEYFEIKAL